MHDRRRDSEESLQIRFGWRPAVDHPPRHVHVYRDGTLIVKWDRDLNNQKAMKGAATGRIPALMRELEAEGLL